MDFVRVNDKLADEVNNLTVFQLKILQPSRDTYDALLVQPHGTMQATEQYVRHADQDVAIQLYQDLINKACEQDVDLLVTPEYCSPWKVIEEIAEKDLKPRQGSLWALGCESITFDDLEAVKIKLTREGVKVLHETPPQQNKDFLCPLVYIFWVNDEGGESSLCMLIQFKTEPSNETIENDHLYCGNDVYIFGDGVSELNFFSLICADVFRITQEQILEYHKNSLIAHIQLNKKPWHPDFTRYRNDLFSVGSNNYVELMCLNWATGIAWDNEGNPDNVITWNNIPNSVFYIPKRLFDKVTDIELDAIHKNGIYYNRVHSHWDSLFFNNAAQAIILRKQPIRFDGSQAMALPLRTLVRKRFIPNQENNGWVEAEAEDANDGFLELLAEYRPADPNLQDGFNRFEANLREIHDNSPLALERCLELLQGPGSTSSWHNRYELKALEVESDESPRRVTTHQEKSEMRKGVVFRKQRLHAGYDAATLYTQSLNWPMPLREGIGQGFNYHWQVDYPHCNVIPVGENGDPATLLYLGSCTLGKAISEYQKMTKFLRDYTLKVSDDQHFLDNIGRAKDNLCVVYCEQHEYKFLHKPEGKSIATPANQSPTSFDAEIIG